MRHTHTYANFVHGVGADYNLRVPSYMRHAVIIGATLMVAAVVLWRALPADQSGLALLIGVIGLLIAAPFVVMWTIIRLMQRGRFGVRDRILNGVQWRGDEQVLDVGTGSGVMLFGAAKRLKTGKAVGIDIYQPNAGGGTQEIFWRNAHIEGVQDRVDLQNIDARHMPFPDASFDVIMSSFALHHIGNAAERAQATREMIRVLKPGGTISLYDVSAAVDASHREMGAAGLQDVRKSGKTLSLLTGKKPRQ